MGFLPLSTTKCGVKEYAWLSLSSYFLWSERTIIFGWFLKTAQNREISGAPAMAILVNRRHPGTDTNTWEHSDARCFRFHFKVHCWEFSLHNTLEDKCLEFRNGSWRRIKHEPQRLWTDTEGIKYFKFKVEKFIQGVERDVERSCRKKESRFCPPESTSLLRPLVDPVASPYQLASLGNQIVGQ